MRASILITLASLLLTSTAFPQTIYVDVNATGSALDGSTWCDAYLHLQDALAEAAAAGGTINEIRVANGAYKPDQGNTQTPGDREATFELVSSVTLIGGFAGCGAPDPHDRDIVVYETVLSGDLAADDVKVPVDDLRTEPTRSENSLHVVTSRGTDELTFFVGFTVRGGNAYVNDTTRGLNGGGMLVSLGSLTLRHCTFRENSAHTSGGGIACFNSTLTVTRCTFVGNTAHQTVGGGGGMYNTESILSIASSVFTGNTSNGLFSRGGGIYNIGFNDIVMTDCVFSGNSAERGGGIWQPTELTRCLFSGNSAKRGGGVYNVGNPTLTFCTFSGNRAHSGAGMYNIGTNSKPRPILNNCTFIANLVYGSGAGGGMYNFRNNRAQLTNCTFIANSGRALVNNGENLSSYRSTPVLRSCIFTQNTGNAAIHNLKGDPTLINCTITANSGAGMMSVLDSNPTVTNGIFWGNLIAEIDTYSDSTSSVTYSIVEGGHPGEGNSDQDPFFIRPPSPGLDGEWGTEDDDFGDLRLQPGSPSIDTGDPNFIPEPGATDLGGRARVLCDRVDMGAYEFVGDYHCNQTLDLRDIAGLQTCFTGEDQAPFDSGCESLDFNGDFDIDLQDLAEFLKVSLP